LNDHVEKFKKNSLKELNSIIDILKDRYHLFETFKKKSDLL